MKNNFLKKFLIAIAFFNVTIVAAQMVGPNAYIKATSLEIGLDGQGGFEGCSTTVSPPLAGMHPRSGNPLFGFVANPQINLWATYDGDFFTPGTPENGWGIEIGTTGGVTASNNATGEFGISGALTDWTNNLDCSSSDWEGDMTSGTDLHIKVNYFLQETDLFYTTTVSITNNTGATIPELFYYRNLDPDNNVSISGDFSTQNTIVSQPGTGCNLAHVSATSIAPSTQPQSYLGLAAIGANWRAMYGGFSNRDGSDIWNGTGFVQTLGSTNFGDEAIAIAYRIQNLAPGATEVLKFVVILDDASASQAINNLLYLSYPGSTIGTPQVCSPDPDTIPTCGATVPISVTGPTLADYTWTWSPATGLSTTTGPSTVANPATNTTYTLSGTPLSSCVVPVSFTFVVFVIPADGNTPVITAVPPLCITSPPFNLTVDSLGGTWSGSGITNSTTGTFDPNVAGVGPNMITYVTPGTCNAIDTMIIMVNGLVNPTITQPPTLCSSGPGYNLTSTQPGGTWSGPGITGTTTGTFDPSLSGPGSFVISYTAPGCSTVDTVTIDVVSAFDPTISPPPSVCSGSASFNLTAATAGGTWTGTGITGPTTGTYNPTTAGTFQVIYTISGGCGAADTVSVTIIPQVNAVIAAATPLCSNGGPINLSASPSGGLWSGTGITNSILGTFNPTASGGGSFTITYNVSGACGDNDTETVTVFTAPAPSITSNFSSICEGLCIGFNESVSATCASVLYNYGDGTTGSVSNPNHCYASAGVYSVTVTCTDANGCVGTITNSNMITVNPIPVANFTYSPSSPMTPNTTVNFTDMTSGSTSSFWMFDDPSSSSNTSILPSTTHSYANEGEYCITLISANSGGCIDTTKLCLEIIDEGAIFIPNVFSPNGDANNDVFLVTSKHMKEVKYDIYDRWGLLIASYNGTTGGWNGETKNGKIAPDGVYYYILKATADNGKLFEHEGFIHLLSEKQ